MAEKLIAVPESLLTDIADAIRLKRDITDMIPVSDMPMQVELIEGGGGGDWSGLPQVTDPSKSIAYMLTAFATGAFKCGTKTWTSAFPNPNEELALETGLDEVHGIILNIAESNWSEAFETGGLQRNRFIIIVVNSNETISVCGINTVLSASGNTAISMNLAQGFVSQGPPLNGSVRFDGGAMYCTGRYNKNANFQMVKTNTEYEWIAW